MRNTYKIDYALFIQELTPEILRDFINRIEIHEDSVKHEKTRQNRLTSTTILWACCKTGKKKRLEDTQPYLPAHLLLARPKAGMFFM